MAKRILVIDDDEDILTILNFIFGEEGFEVVFFQSGTDIEHIKALYPDIILLDVRIIGFPKSGAQICAEIKKELALNQIPVILVSAEYDLDELAKNCGANGYVRKPFDIDMLLAKVKEFVT